MTVNYKLINSVELDRKGRIWYKKAYDGVEFGPCAGITASLPLMQIGGQFIFPDTIAVPYTPLGIYFDPANYVGVVDLNWEIVVENLKNQILNFEIVDELGTVYDTIAVPQTPTGRFTHFIAGFAPDLINPHFYRLKTPGGNFNAEITWSLLSANVVGGSIVRDEIQLMVGTDGGTGFFGTVQDDVDNSYQLQFQTADINTVYSDANRGPILWVKQNLKRVLDWEFEVWGAMLSDTTKNGYVALFNATTGMMVAGSQVVVNGLHPTHYSVPIALNALNFTDGDTFKVQYKVDAGYDSNVQQFSLYNIKLYPRLTCGPGGGGGGGFGMTDEVRIPLGNLNEPVCPAPHHFNLMRAQLYQYQASKWANVTFYYEATAKTSSGPGESSILRDIGLLDYATTGFVVTPFTDIVTIGPFSTVNYETIRSGPIVLTDQHRFYTANTENTGGVGSLDLISSFIIAKVTTP